MVRYMWETCEMLFLVLICHSSSRCIRYGCMLEQPRKTNPDYKERRVHGGAALFCERSWCTNWHDGIRISDCAEEGDNASLDMYSPFLMSFS